MRDKLAVILSIADRLAAITNKADRLEHRSEGKNASNTKHS